jgi:hypothetical protein
MRGGRTFARGGTRTWGGRNWSGRNWSGNWRHYRFSNDVIFLGDFGFPGWWGWDYRTDITVTTITRMITMGTAGTVTTMTPVMDTTMAVDQGICGVCGVGDKHGLRPLEFALLFVCPDHHLRATSVEPSAASQG